MRKAIQSILMFVLLTSFESGVIAIGKTTIDPSSQPKGATTSNQEYEEGELLAQQITYEARHKAIKDILADLSMLTALEIEAGKNDRDWQVRDRRMNIFAKSVSLASLMNSIAATMQFKWQRSVREGMPTYRLYMDRKTLLSAEAKRSRFEAKARDDILSRREQFVLDMMNSEDLSESDLEKLESENPYLYLMAKRGSLAFIRSLFNESPDAARAVALCERITPGGKVLTAEL